jgi:hypothetical protein
VQNRCTVNIVHQFLTPDENLPAKLTRPPVLNLYTISFDDIFEIRITHPDSRNIS